MRSYHYNCFYYLHVYRDHIQALAQHWMDTQLSKHKVLFTNCTERKNTQHIIKHNKMYNSCYNMHSSYSVVGKNLPNFNVLLEFGLYLRAQVGNGGTFSRQVLLEGIQTIKWMCLRKTVGTQCCPIYLCSSWLP